MLMEVEMRQQVAGRQQHGCRVGRVLPYLLRVRMSRTLDKITC